MELPLVVNVSLKSRSYALCNSLFAIYRYYMYSVRLSTMHEDHFTIAIAIAIFLRQFCPRGKGGVRLPNASNCPKDTC